jgi:hypothetical protein
MPLKPDVLDRLLLSKSFLERIRFQPVAVHDRHTLASNIIAAHDSAELAIAAICSQLGCQPQKGNSYLMDYLSSLKAAKHPERDVSAREYFRNLNDTRSLLKHQGLYPDGRQWSRVGETVFQHITKWSWDYLGESFAELDESALLVDPEIKSLYDSAKKYFESGGYKGALESLASALSLLFERNPALRGFDAGFAKSEDAIRLAGFGVHGNDYLALQEFLPRITRWGDKANFPQWKQSEYGHPGNWRKQTVDFCLRTFVDVAIKIQGAQWIPGALSRSVLYDQQIEAIAETVEIWRDVPRKTGAAPIGGLGFLLPPSEMEREVVRVLHRGEKIRGHVSLANSQNSFPVLLGGVKSTDTLDVSTDEELFWGKVKLAEVRVTCVPRNHEFVRQNFQWLPEIEWEPE